MCKFIHFAHEIIVFRARPRDAGRVRFLKGIIADEVRCNLSGQANNRNAVHEGIRKPGDAIRCTGTGSHQDDADLAGRARISLRRMNRALFMANEDVAKFLLLEQRIIGRQHGPTRIAENDLNPLINQGLEDDFCARHPILIHTRVLAQRVDVFWLLVGRGPESLGFSDKRHNLVGQLGGVNEN